MEKMLESPLDCKEIQRIHQKEIIPECSLTSALVAATGVLAQAAATGVLSTAKRSHPMSEVRGRSLEDFMPEGQWPRGINPRPRSGAAAESTRPRRRRKGREELPRVQGRAGGGGMAERRYPAFKVRSGN